MDFFSNKREKICVFFKSRGVIVALFLLYLIYIKYFSLRRGRNGWDGILLKP